MRDFLRRQGWFAAVILVVLVVAVGVAVVVVANRGGDGDDAAASEGNPFADGASGLTGGCAEVHAGHNVMMWDSVMADEMVEADCGWPYEPFNVPVEGGTVDPAFDAAPFEPVLYQDVWSLLSADVGATCTIGPIFEEVEGLVFGFRYEIATEACTELGEGDVVVAAREYASRGLRDAAAHDATGDAVLVLGRWAITVDGPDDAVAATEAGLVEMGAIPVGDAGP